jgi:hypothetical protein
MMCKTNIYVNHTYQHTRMTKKKEKYIFNTHIPKNIVCGKKK